MCRARAKILAKSERFWPLARERLLRRLWFHRKLFIVNQLYRTSPMLVTCYMSFCTFFQSHVFWPFAWDNFYSGVRWWEGRRLFVIPYKQLAAKGLSLTRCIISCLVLRCRSAGQLRQENRERGGFESRPQRQANRARQSHNAKRIVHDQGGGCLGTRQYHSCVH